MGSTCYLGRVNRRVVLVFLFTGQTKAGAVRDGCPPDHSPGFCHSPNPVTVAYAHEQLLSPLCVRLGLKFYLTWLIFALWLNILAVCFHFDKTHKAICHHWVRRTGGCLDNRWFLCRRGTRFHRFRARLNGLSCSEGDSAHGGNTTVSLKS